MNEWITHPAQTRAKVDAQTRAKVDAQTRAKVGITSEVSSSPFTLYLL